MHCDICKRQLEKDGPVYRFWGVPSGFWPFARNKSVISACTRCGANPPQKRSNEGSVYTFQRFEHAYPPQPCQHCGRPVYADRQRRLRYFVCGDQCRIAIYNANAREKLKQRGQRPVPKQPCIICGEPFTPKRSDAIYCSAACKQRGYRSKQTQRAGGQAP
jgi:hypothetical protein